MITLKIPKISVTSTTGHSTVYCIFIAKSRIVFHCPQEFQSHSPVAISSTGADGAVESDLVWSYLQPVDIHN